MNTFQRPYTLVICEKPKAAERIAYALGNSVVKEKTGSHSVFSVTGYKNERYVVCPAIGHLYGLIDPKKNRSVYPIFDPKWAPIVKKGSKKHAQIINSISSLSQNAARFVHACDYDQEGEVIGYNILEYACDKQYEKSYRAKFSTLTEEDIRKSFENMSRPNTNLADAGRSRHMIDFLYGVNFSRALTQSYKVSNDGKRYCNLSIGRVQGPTLAFVVDRDMEIKNHVSEPYWVISADFEKDGSTISAHYYKSRISTLFEATSIVSACKNQDGSIDEIESQKLNLKAGPAFNLGDLQMEAYRVFRFSPSYTLSIAEKLYIAALISYPRTSSQKLPASINYKQIISGISKFGFPYIQLANMLLASSHLSPIEGNKADPAHPAIYPTGKKPKSKLSGTEFKLLDLIIRRFLASFGDSAVIENKTVTIHVKDKHYFIADGKKLLYDGWTRFYKPYLSFTEIILPELHEGEILRNAIVSMSKKYTQPPPRFNQASLLELMEKENIGTKATRSEIISTLFKRNYISNITDYGNGRGTERGTQRVRGGIEATEIGLQIVHSMRKYVPIIVSANLSRSMEEQLEGIETGRAMSSKVISQASSSLNQIIAAFKQNENHIGKLLTDSVLRYRNKLQQQRLEDEQKSFLGSCPTCNSGYLKIIKSRATKKRFVGCSNYSKGICKAAAPLPQAGLILNDGRKCNLCKWPLLKVVYKTKRRWEFCVNSLCSSKNVKALTE